MTGAGRGIAIGEAVTPASSCRHSKDEAAIGDPTDRRKLFQNTDAASAVS